MNNNIKIIFSFVIGAAVGSVVTYKLIKTKYEQIAQEEIDSVKEVYSRKKSKQIIETEEPVDFANDDYEEYANILSEEQYVKKGGSDMKPKIIPPEDFGENEDYETISLIYYEDEVLTDDMDEPIDDIENTVGLGYDTHFGEYEDDTVYVVNDRLKCYYEICRDYGNYSDRKVDKE